MVAQKGLLKIATSRLDHRKTIDVGKRGATIVDREERDVVDLMQLFEQVIKMQDVSVA